MNEPSAILAKKYLKFIQNLIKFGDICVLYKHIKLDKSLILDIIVNRLLIGAIEPLTRVGGVPKFTGG
jgi:hypothetical protein